MRKDFQLYRPISLYDGYFITEDGFVFSNKSSKLIQLKCNPDNDGYVRIELYNGFGSKRVSVHRLVAEAFIPNPLNLPCVNHIDSNRSNNSVSNLEWTTQKDNINHSWLNGRCEDKRKIMLMYSKTIGSRMCKENSRNRRKFTDAEIKAIKYIYQAGLSQMKISKLFNCGQPTICKIINELRYVN